MPILASSTFWNFSNNSLIIKLKVQPRAAKNCIIGQHAGELKIALTAVPDHGKANSALITFLAETFKIAKSSIVITQGTTNQHKTVKISSPSAKLVTQISQLAKEL